MRIAVVIPTIGTEGYIYGLVYQLIKQDEFAQMYVYVNLPEESILGDQLTRYLTEDNIKVIRCPEGNLHHMWNLGIGEAAADGYDVIVFLYDELEIGNNFLSELVAPLYADDDIWVSEAEGSLVFAVSMRSFIEGLPDFDEHSTIEYGNKDFFLNVKEVFLKKSVVAEKATVKRKWSLSEQ